MRRVHANATNHDVVRIAHTRARKHHEKAALELAKEPEMTGKTICVIIPSFGER